MRICEVAVPWDYLAWIGMLGLAPVGCRWWPHGDGASAWLISADGVGMQRVSGALGRLGKTLEI